MKETYTSVREVLGLSGNGSSVGIRTLIETPAPGCYRPKLVHGLRSVMQSLSDPGCDSWSYIGKTSNDQLRKHKGDIQGLATDNAYWYVSFREGVRKLNLQMSSTVEDPIALPAFGEETRYNHFGALTLSAKHLYVPLEHSTKKVAGVVGVFRKSDFVRSDLSEGLVWTVNSAGQYVEQTSFPWCALSPVDGFLYTSNYHNVKTLNVYDVSHHQLAEFSLALRPKYLEAQAVSPFVPHMQSEEKNRALLKNLIGSLGMEFTSIESLFSSCTMVLHMLYTNRLPYTFIGRFALDLPGDDQPDYEFDNIGGGCFSSTGHLYITKDLAPKGIFCFSGHTGALLGVKLLAEEHWEIEGIAVSDPAPPGSEAIGGLGWGRIHIAFQGCDADDWDEADVKHWDVDPREGTV